MAYHVANVALKKTTTAVTTAAAVVLDTGNFPYPMTVTAIPGGGGTMQVEFSTTPTAAGTPGTATWIAWPSGVVATTTSDTLLSPVVALRFTATTTAGTVEVIA